MRSMYGASGGFLDYGRSTSHMDMDIFWIGFTLFLETCVWATNLLWNTDRAPELARRTLAHLNYAVAG